MLDRMTFLVFNTAVNKNVIIVVTFYSRLNGHNSDTLQIKRLKRWLVLRIRIIYLSESYKIAEFQSRSSTLCSIYFMAWPLFVQPYSNQGLNILDFLWKIWPRVQYFVRKVYFFCITYNNSRRARCKFR